MFVLKAVGAFYKAWYMLKYRLGRGQREYCLKCLKGDYAYWLLDTHRAKLVYPERCNHR